MRRLFVLALGSALLASACGTSSFWPGASSAASQAVTGSSTTPSSKPSPVATKTKAAPTLAAPTPTEVASSADVTAGWSTFAPAGAGFSVLMPGEPVLKTSNSTDATTSLWTYEDGADLAYFVAEAKYTKGSLSGQPAATVYTNALAGMAKSGTGMTISAQGDVTVSGHAGKSFTLTSTGATAKGYLFVVGDNLYMVYAYWAPAVDGSPDMDAFLASFAFAA